MYQYFPAYCRIANVFKYEFAADEKYLDSTEIMLMSMTVKFGLLLKLDTELRETNHNNKFSFAGLQISTLIDYRNIKLVLDKNKNHWASWGCWFRKVYLLKENSNISTKMWCAFCSLLVQFTCPGCCCCL